MNFEKFVNDWELINPTSWDKNSENSPLCTLQYVLFTDDSLIKLALAKFIISCKTDLPGLYHQNPPGYKNLNKKDDYMSPDQLITFVCFFSFIGHEEKIKLIWEHLLSHLFTYDNLTGEINFDRTMQVKAVASAAVARGGFWKFVFLPILVIGCMYSFRPKKRGVTSGKLKVWTIVHSLGMDRTLAMCTWLLRFSDFPDWESVFEEYYKEDNHPLRKLSEGMN